MIFKKFPEFKKKEVSNNKILQPSMVQQMKKVN